MVSEKYVWKAIDFVIDYAKEQGLKYRRGDFKDISFCNKTYDNCVFNTYQNCGYKNTKAIQICLRYDFERCGRSLKQAKDKFLSYMYVRVKNDGIYFIFTYRELDLLILKENGENTEDKIEKIISKVTKLLELADLEKNNSEKEAIAASLKAQELLVKYNLDLCDIQGDKKENIEEIIADVPSGFKWKYSLAEVVARSYRCRFYIIGSNNIVFYGYRSDSLIARRVFIYLFNVGNRLANAYVKVMSMKLYNTNGIYNSFCAGYVKGINTELSRNSTALAIIVPSEVNENFEEFSKNFRNKGNFLNVIDDTAYENGIVEGKRAMNAQYLEA
ncbi:MAG: DUF2786 domain-containing protein [Oscillospiraceae bacterium]|nr:DUF2786 domain-containing protein [Oscillospiraceae bacterium]